MPELDPHLDLCHKCMNKYLEDPGTLEMACASVGIEYGKTQDQMLRDYFKTYHENDHKESA